jgi:hypothetical protein
MLVTKHRVWIGNRIYAINYSAIANTHCLQFTLAGTNTTQSTASSTVVAW